MLPELGRIGPVVLRTYTLLLDLAILVGLGLLALFGHFSGEKPSRWVDAGLGAIAGGIVLGRLGHVAIHWAYFSEHMVEIAQVWRGGIDWHGAVVGGLAALAVGCRLLGLNFRAVTDALSFILPMGAALTYSGCLMVSCGHGREVASLADYPRFLVAELPDLYGVVAPRLASQLYGVVLSLLLIVVAGILAWRVQRQGVRFWIVLGLLGLIAFGIGFTRGDAVPPVGSLRLDQVLDLGIVALALTGTLIASRPLPVPPEAALT